MVVVGRMVEVVGAVMGVQQGGLIWLAGSWRMDDWERGTVG